MVGKAPRFDGGQHSENVADAERDAHFAQQGFRTLRFWNDEVERDLDGVCATVLNLVVR
jgi:very-short-patch-repair endonuclease